MRSRRSRWMSGVGTVVLAGGLALADYGPTGTPAMAAPLVKEDPHMGVTQNWDKILPAATRFVVLPGFATTTNGAVRDNETGLVWEQSPYTESAIGWSSARNGCISKNVGGRNGWRLPSIPELTSLIDPSVSSGPKLPPGHPFINVSAVTYWSASTDASNSALAWLVYFEDGSVFPLDKTAGGPRAWCVRGGMNSDAY